MVAVRRAAESATYMRPTSSSTNKPTSSVNTPANTASVLRHSATRPGLGVAASSVGSDFGSIPLCIPYPASGVFSAGCTLSVR